MRGSEYSDRQGGVDTRAGRDYLTNESISSAQKVLLILLPLALLAAIAAALFAHFYDEPTQLSGYHLEGERAPTAVNVLVLTDVSGSFSDYDVLRVEAMRQLFAWVPENLFAVDTFTIVSFAGDATTTIDTVTVEELSQDAVSFSQDAPVMGGTNILPALELGRSQLDGAAPVAIVTLTDTAALDLSDAQINNELAAMKATTMSTIVPAGVDVWDEWKAVFPWSEIYYANSDDPDSVALALGEALAHATGQQLVEGENSSN